MKIIAITFLVLASLFLINFVSADIINPLFPPIDLENKIANIRDFQEYTFLQVSKGPMCHNPTIINDEGIIEGDYKFCKIFIYAAKNSEFNKSILNISRDLAIIYSRMNNNISEDYPELVEVIKDIEVYKTVPITSSYYKETREYKIDPLVFTDKTKVTNEYNSKYKYNYLVIIAYILIPALCLYFTIKIIRGRKNE